MKSLVLGKLEQEILSIIWDANQPLSVKEVLEKCNCDHAYTTVMTVMSRMEKKGILKREAKGKSYLYSPVDCRQSYADKHLDSIFQSIVNIYGDVAISKFVDSIKDDKENLKLLEDYLAKNGTK